MDNRIVSTAVLTLSRQQEKFLELYRTHDAQKAYFESYGLGVTPFFRGGGGSHGVISPSPEPELPYDYEVEYLEVTAESIGPYIDTGLVLQSYGHSIIDISFFFENLVSSYPMIVTNDFRSRNPFFNIHFDKNFLYVAPLGFDYITTSYSLNSLYHVIIDNYSGNVEINGNMFYSTSRNVEANDKSLKIFSNVSDTFFAGKFYELKIFESGNLTHHFISVVKDFEGCIFDKITSEFLYNSGTGNFIIGPRKL